MSGFLNTNARQIEEKNVAIQQRKKVVGISGAKALKDKADAYAIELKPVLKELKEQGVVGHTAIARAFSTRQIPTARGGQWTVRAITNLIGRLAVIKASEEAV